jgi:hypothetical protein
MRIFNNNRENKFNISLKNSSTTSTSELIGYFDKSTRFLLLISYLIYFLITIIFKKTRKFQLVQLHHVNFCGFLLSILTACWSFNSYPAFTNQNLNIFICYISETLFGTIKYTMSYSILILAIYRYFAVFKNHVYKKISNSYVYALISIFFSWLISLAIFFISKYSIGSTYGYQCLDGNGNGSLKRVLIYFSITNSIGFLMPYMIVVLIYVCIQNKLNEISVNLSRNNSRKNSKAHHTSNTSLFKKRKLSNNQNNNDLECNKIKTHKERSFTLQLVLINSIEIMYFIINALVKFLWASVDSDNSNINNDSHNLKIILNAINNLVQSIIPIITLYFILKQ